MGYDIGRQGQGVDGVHEEVLHRVDELEHAQGL